MKTKLILFLLLPFSFILSAFAGSATWNLQPATGKWTTATNWTPATVPNGPADVATFATSNTRFITLTGPIEVSGIVFSSGASTFNLTVSLNNNLLLRGSSWSRSATQARTRSPAPLADYRKEA
jgi:hypothetical protein